MVLRPGAGGGEAGPGARAGLFVAWAVDAAAPICVLGAITRAVPGSRTGPLWRLVAAAAGLIGASVAVHLGGRPTAALVVAGGPPAVALGVLGLALLLLVTVGRNARWN